MCCFRLPDGSLMEITKVYPLDAVFDTPEDVPEDVSRNFFMILLSQICLVSPISTNEFLPLCRSKQTSATPALLTGL